METGHVGVYARANFSVFFLNGIHCTSLGFFEKNFDYTLGTKL